MSYTTKGNDNQEIKCPFCNACIGREDQLEQLVTYWGEEPARAIECRSCGAEYFVKEHVERTYTICIPSEQNP